MKYNVIFTTIIALAVSSQLIFAGEIADTYTAGDTLTAAKMDNIKAAVNDNNNASRFYGDGSAGELTISADTSWDSTPPAGNNLNFTNVVIDAGSTLFVPAGTTIRCSGTFTNNGLIAVYAANNKGRVFSINTEASISRIDAPGRGDAQGAAGNPDAHTLSGVILNPGSGGMGIPRTVAASSFNNFRIGGGAGGGTQLEGGSNGGGLVKILCGGAISNNGAIQANGSSGDGGGGGGGIVILASSTSIANNLGTINAIGGNGINSTTNNGAGGGGGGGIIIMAAPTISNTGTTNVSGGTAGTSGTTVSIAAHSAGGGGGASGGNGGSGGSISDANLAYDGNDGGDGYVLEIVANPAHMM
jgi:hypothetical protein